jgi:hypothetical protein
MIPLSHSAVFVVTRKHIPAILVPFPHLGETLRGLLSMGCSLEYDVADIELAGFLATVLAQVLVGV